MSEYESVTLNHPDDTEMTNNTNSNTNMNPTPAPPQSQESHNNNMNDDDDDHVVLEEEDMFTTVTATTTPGVPPRDNNHNFATSSSTSNTSTSTTTTTNTRYDTFTEAVPLSLSSMAHLNIPLTDGVVDGIIQVIHHTLIQCVHYITRLYGTTNSNANAAQHGSSPASPGRPTSRGRACPPDTA